MDVFSYLCIKCSANMLETELHPTYMFVLSWSLLTSTFGLSWLVDRACIFLLAPTPPPRTRPRGHHQPNLRGQQRAAGVPYLPRHKGGPVHHWQANLPGGLFQALYRYREMGPEDSFTHQHGESHVLAVSKRMTTCCRQCWPQRHVHNTPMLILLCY